MSKRILITGASGQLGNSVLNVLNSKYISLATDVHQSINTGNHYQRLDITNRDEIENVLTKFHPDVIINLAAFTDVDGCETNVEKAYLLNTKSVEMLSEKFGGYFIQISTDYIFDGLNGPYYENDETNPKSIYGKTKLDAERVLQDNSNNCCILRTNVLYDYYPGTSASFIKWVIDSLNHNIPINIVNDQWNNPTWTQHLAEIIELIIDKNVQGIYNYGGADYLSRFDFAKIIADIFKLDNSLISPISTKSLNQIAPRPLKGGLIADKIEKDFNIKCVNLVDSLNAIKIRLKE